MLSRPRTLFVSATVVSLSIGLVVACTGGPGGLGDFGDDGLGQSSSTQTTTSSGASSSGRTSSSTSTSTSTSSGTTTSSGVSSSGTTTSSGVSSSGTTTSSGGSSGQPTTFACGTTGLQCSSSTQYCIKPCCPSQPDCYAADAGTTCPTGYQYGFCPTEGVNGCVQSCLDGNAYKCSSSTSLPSIIGRSCSTNLQTRAVNCTCN